MLRLICPKIRETKLKAAVVSTKLKDVSAIKAMSKFPSELASLQQDLQISFVVFRQRGQRRYLVYDGSQTKLLRPKKCLNLLLLQNGKFVKKFGKKQQQFPLVKFVYPVKNWVEKNLIELLNLNCQM